MPGLLVSGLVEQHRPGDGPGLARAAGHLVAGCGAGDRDRGGDPGGRGHLLPAVPGGDRRFRQRAQLAAIPRPRLRRAGPAGNGLRGRRQPDRRAGERRPGRMEGRAGRRRDCGRLDPVRLDLGRSRRCRSGPLAAGPAPAGARDGLRGAAVVGLAALPGPPADGAVGGIARGRPGAPRRLDRPDLPSDAGGRGGDAHLALLAPRPSVRGRHRGIPDRPGDLDGGAAREPGRAAADRRVRSDPAVLAARVEHGPGPQLRRQRAVAACRYRTARRGRPDRPGAVDTDRVPPGAPAAHRGRAGAHRPAGRSGCRYWRSVSR